MSAHCVDLMPHLQHQLKLISSILYEMVSFRPDHMNINRIKVSPKQCRKLEVTQKIINMVLQSKFTETVNLKFTMNKPEQIKTFITSTIV